MGKGQRHEGDRRDGGRERGSRRREAPLERGTGGPNDPDRIAAAARAAVEAIGFQVIFARTSPNRRVVVMVDRRDGGPVTVADCEIASRAVEGALRALGHDPGAFFIEVESPGADRPLTSPEDFVRFRGVQVTVTLRESREGRRNFTGLLVGYDNGDVTVHVLDEAAPETFRGPEIREVRLHPKVERPAERPPRR